MASPLEKVTPDPKAPKPGDGASSSASGYTGGGEEVCKDLLDQLDAAADEG